MYSNQQIAAMNRQELEAFQKQQTDFLTQYDHLSERELQPVLRSLLIEIEKLPEELKDELEAEVNQEYPELYELAKTNTHWDCLMFKRSLEILKERQGNEAKNSLVVA